jgi:hypothetical protein
MKTTKERKMNDWLDLVDIPKAVKIKRIKADCLYGGKRLNAECMYGKKKLDAECMYGKKRLDTLCMDAIKRVESMRDSVVRATKKKAAK